MKELNRLFLVAGTLLAFYLGAGKLAAQPAQPPGAMNFDPQQMQQRMQQFMMDAVRDRLSVTNDDEWKVIEPRLSKVMQLRMESVLGSLGGFAGMRMGGRGGDNAAGGQRRFPALGQSSPEADALQKSLDANAPASEIQVKLTQLREARKRKQAALVRAQDELRQVLSVHQEATLVMMGLLD